MSRLLGVGGLVACLVVATVQSAPAPSGKDEPTRTASEAEVARKALEQITDFVHEDASISLVLGQLTELTKVPFAFDKSLVGEIGVDPNEIVVSAKLKQVKIRTGLQSMLRSYGMTYVVLGNQIIVTSEEKALTLQMRQRIDVDYSEEPLQKVLRDLSRRTATNIVLDPRSSKSKLNEKPITLQLDDVSLESAVRLIADLADLRAVRVGNVLFVTTEERAEKLKQDQETPPNPFSPFQVPPGFGGGGGVVPVPANDK